MPDFGWGFLKENVEKTPWNRSEERGTTILERLEIAISQHDAHACMAALHHLLLSPASPFLFAGREASHGCLVPHLYELDNGGEKYLAIFTSEDHYRQKNGDALIRTEMPLGALQFIRRCKLGVVVNPYTDGFYAGYKWLKDIR